MISLLNALKSKKVILASASPRRIEIFKKNLMLENVIVKVSTTDEKKIEKQYYSDPKLFVQQCALAKAEDVLSKETSLPDLIVACDTIVVKDSKIYGKPTDGKDAHRMLRELSGVAHQVISGVAILFPKASQDKKITFFEATDVTFCKLTDQEIEDYISTKEPLDKAGSYGIQGVASVLIESIKGDYFNVVGFPIHKFVSTLETLKSNIQFDE